MNRVCTVIVPVEPNLQVSQAKRLSQALHNGQENQVPVWLQCVYVILLCFFLVLMS